MRGGIPREFVDARIVELTGWTEDMILNTRGHFLDYLHEYIIVKREVEQEQEARQRRVQENHRG